MPPTVAPPPRTGEAAQGQWIAEESSAATDRAAGTHDEPAPVPAHPTPAAAARTAAAGGLFAALALVTAGVGVAVIVTLRLILAADEKLSIDGPSLVLIVIGFGVAYAAALTLITRVARPATLIFATAASIAWPLSGHALLGGLVAVGVVSLLVFRDLRIPGSARAGVTVGIALIAAATVVTIVGAATAPTSKHAAPRAETPRYADEDLSVRGMFGDGEAPKAASDAGDGETKAPEATPTATPKPKPEVTPKPKPAATPQATAEPVAPAEDTAQAPADTPNASAPAEPAPVSQADSAKRFVRGYYADLNAQRFDEAWAQLSPAVQANLGPYARWKAGYGTTLSSTPRDFAVDGSSVTHILVARDKGCDRARQFRVTWRLQRDGSDWTVTGLAATAAGPQEC
ncbi:hypothetical protein OJ998_04585 [Solirubrobacter taibaiensis]|nr:hypothetical protein [Solirubrobacter taibaiensis]